APSTPAAAPPAALPSAHASLVCVALPAFAVSAEHGQLDGSGLEGFYHGGRRLLSRCQVRVSGAEPVALQGRMTAAGRARFIATVRTGAEPGPDPDVILERLRNASGLERLTLFSSATRPLRLQLEAQLGTDLAELGAIAAGAAGGEVDAGVWESGLRWAAAGAQSVVTADPPPDTAVASAGLLRWELQLPPGGRHTIELR
ncbi:glycogen debranching N-terminal domain-containing protein, partial [Streptomyces coryli]|uniref:glycogen debranching N-terminal domain-containing protein n=1 Tax=Streptomyces coryli TaxID=1128680 RepID=UPI003B82D618